MERVKKVFEFTPPRISEYVLLVSRSNIVSLVNAGTIQVLKTLQDNDYYYILNIDDVETVVELES